MNDNAFNESLSPKVRRRLLKATEPLAKLIRIADAFDERIAILEPDDESLAASHATASLIDDPDVLQGWQEEIEKCAHRLRDFGLPDYAAELLMTAPYPGENDVLPDPWDVEVSGFCPLIRAWQNTFIDHVENVDETRSDQEGLEIFASLVPDGELAMKLSKILSDTRKSSNTRMIEASDLNPELYVLDSVAWEPMLKVSSAAVRKTDFWKRIRPDMIAKARALELSRRKAAE